MASWPRGGAWASVCVRVVFDATIGPIQEITSCTVPFGPGLAGTVHLDALNELRHLGPRIKRDTHSTHAPPSITQSPCSKEREQVSKVIYLPTRIPLRRLAAEAQDGQRERCGRSGWNDLPRITTFLPSFRELGERDETRRSEQPEVKTYFQADVRMPVIPKSTSTKFHDYTRHDVSSVGGQAAWPALTETWMLDL
ncbi:hypothetical protein B0H12DRAFT_1079250 [Mycena haematopus]|nr:hypothetical protein B0H12DRAFT_1079250 [Mycena haematopus]